MLPEYDRWNWRRYVRKVGRRVKINKWKWWDRKFEQISALLRGRYEAIRLGADPGSMEQLFETLHPPRLAKDTMLRIVAFVDAHAQEDRKNAIDNRSEENR